MSQDALLEWLRRIYPGAEFASGEVGAEPLHCGDPSREYSALTEKAGLVLAPLWAPILVEGPDAVAYLHRRLSQSIEALPLGSGAHALQLGGDGRMQADLLVYRGVDALFVLAERPFAAANAELIEKYVLTDNVTVERQWQAEAQVGLAGPRAPAIIRSLADQVFDAEVLERDRWIGFFTVTLAGLPCRIFGDGRWRVPYYHLSIPRMAFPQLLGALDEACRREGGCAAGVLASELLRIESGVPRFGLDTTERTIPLEAGLAEALNYDKGCYPGQEVIARITNLGHPAHVLARLTLAGEWPLTPGARLEYQEQQGRADEPGHESGWLSSAVTWPGLGRTEALGYLNWADREAGQVVVVAGDTRLPAQVQSLRPQEPEAG